MTNATRAAMHGPPREGTNRNAFGGISKNALRPPNDTVDYLDIQRSAQFRRLNRRMKWFVFPMTVFFLAWYIGYVVLAAYAPDFMAEPVFGAVNMGLLLGVGQFVTTVGITTAYVQFTRRRIDPEVDQLRKELDGGSA